MFFWQLKSWRLMANNGSRIASTAFDMSDVGKPDKFKFIYLNLSEHNDQLGYLAINHDYKYHQ